MLGQKNKSCTLSAAQIRIRFQKGFSQQWLQNPFMNEKKGGKKKEKKCNTDVLKVKSFK